MTDADKTTKTDDERFWKFDFPERNIKNFADIRDSLEEFSYFEDRRPIFPKMQWSSNTNGHLIITIRAEDYPGKTKTDMAPLCDFLLQKFDEEVERLRAGP